MQCIIFSWWILWVEIKPGLGGNSLQLFWGAKGRSLSRMRWWRAVHRVCIHANWSTSRHSLLPGRWRRPHLKVSRWNYLVYFLGSPILQLTSFCFRLIPNERPSFVVAFFGVAKSSCTILGSLQGFSKVTQEYFDCGWCS